MKQQDYISNRKRAEHHRRQPGILMNLLLVSILLSGLIPLEAVSKESEGELSHKEDLVTGASINPVNMIYEDGLLSAWIISAPLTKVMEEVRRLTGVQVLWEEGATSQAVSAKFRGLPLDDALDEILRGGNYILTYAKTEEVKELVRITVLPDVSASIKPLLSESGDFIQGPEEADIPDGLRDDLFAMRPLEREELTAEMKEVNRKIGQFETLMMDDKEKAEEELKHVLATESDSRVRMSALATLTEFDEIPIDTFIEIALYESEPALKNYAVGFLAMHKDKDTRIEAVLNEQSINEYAHTDEWEEFEQ